MSVVRPRRKGASEGRARGWSAVGWRWAWAAVLIPASGLVWFRLMGPIDAGGLRREAEAAMRAGRKEEAAALWGRINASDAATAESLVAEAKAMFESGTASRAERLLERASRLEPGKPDSWRLLLELYRIEDRPFDALAVGRRALSAVELRGRDRVEVLSGLTLALLAQVPTSEGRGRLKRWAEADEEDMNARVALLRGDAQGDGTRPSFGRDETGLSRHVETMRGLIARHPAHGGLREALISALGDAGDVAGGRELLEGWPTESRGGAYWRLRGRWDLEYDGRAVEAAAGLRRVLGVMPYDWKSRSRLARALSTIGFVEEARLEAERVDRHRELLNPGRLGSRLEAALGNVDRWSSRRDLSELTAALGLEELSEAWRETLGGVAAAP